MKKIQLSPELHVSQFIHGHWRVMDWDLSIKEFSKLTQQTIDLGITTFDHADIYGDYKCEKAFGKVLKTNPKMRQEIQLITKCGIKLVSDKFPHRKIKTYDYSYNHIINSADNSLRNLETDHIDLFLLHRPSPFFNPEEVSKAFEKLKSTGKVLQFGVSNFSPAQFEMLNKHLDMPLVTNQIEISPYNLNAFNDGSIDFMLKERIKPLAWSPLAGGEIFKPTSDKGKRLLNELTAIGNELGEKHIDKIIYSWLLKHPSEIVPIIGTGKLSRLQNAAESVNLKMTDEQWYRIYIASLGEELP